jgi:Polyketide cyclase / dehydrase and lipid transport
MNLIHIGNKMILAQGRNSSFSHSIDTTASHDRVWKLWTDVSTWSKWDGGLKSASLEGQFGVGAIGKIVPLRGSIVPFSVTAHTPNTSSAFVTKLPFAKLNIERSLVNLPSNGTRFTHTVTFTGPLREVWGFILGRGFRRELPLTMAKLAALAEV